MFLTREEWRHPNRYVQALASPAVAWCCIAVGFIRALLLVEVRHQDAGESHSEWILLPQFEALTEYLSCSPTQIGAVQVLMPPHISHGDSWELERVVALREWSSGVQTGVEYQTESGKWHSSEVREIDTQIIRSWTLHHSSWHDESASP